MTDLDKMIEEALDAEDRSLFANSGEQGMFGQIGALFTGKNAGWNFLTGAAQIAMFAVAVYAGLRFLSASEAAELARFGALAWLAATAVIFIKTWFWMQMQSNRILREIKRVELQVARLQKR
jgi:hypothetical protein